MGRAALVDVQFAPARTGVVVGRMTVASNDPDSPELRIELRGEGLAAPILELAPETVLATVAAGERGSETLTIHNRGGSPLDFRWSAVPEDLANPLGCAPLGAWVTDSRTVLRFERGSPSARPLTDLLTSPGAMVLSPDGRSAHVVERWNTGGLFRVDLDTGATTLVSAEIAGGLDLALTSDGLTAIVLEAATGRLSSVDLVTGRASSIAPPMDISAIELDPSESFVWVSSSFRGWIKQIDVTTGEQRDAFDFLPAPFDGFGAQANYTYVDSSAPSPIPGQSVPLENLSENSYNLIALYDRGPLSARLAYNWRDKYVSATSGDAANRPLVVKAMGQLDASIGYDVSSALTIGLDAQNLTRNELQDYYGTPLLPKSGDGERWADWAYAARDFMGIMGPEVVAAEVLDLVHDDTAVAEERVVGALPSVDEDGNRLE